MLFSTLLHRHKRQDRQAKLFFRPSLERLEERCVPAIFSNAAQFSATLNPHGTWSYGYLTPSATPELPDASTFTLYTQHGKEFNSIYYWDTSGTGLAPAVFLNTANQAVSFLTVTIQPHQAAFHPGPNGEYSVYRFAAPSASFYALGATFTGIDNHGGADKDIHVLDNGVELYNDLLPGSYGSTKMYSTTVGLAKGDRIDFVVGYGTGPYYYDTTALNATLTQIAGAATHLTVAGPSSSTAGTPFSVTVTALDFYNHVATSYTGTVHFTSSDSQAVLPGDYTFTATDKGKHAFTNAVTLKTAGSRTVTATDTLTSSISGKHTVKVNPAAASQLIVKGPASVAAGTAFSITVTALDPYNNVATGYTGTVSLTSSDLQATLPTPYTFQATDKGAHTFTGLILRTKGQQTVTVTDAIDGLVTTLNVNVT